MSKESLLATMIEHDVFANEEQKVPGIAQLAIDEGYEKLTPAQKRVLEPFMSHSCDGVENPGGHHNDCDNTLVDDELENAYENQGYYGAMLCSGCIDEKEEYKRQWDRLEQE